jgi:hypothetical protein
MKKLIILSLLLFTSFKTLAINVIDIAVPDEFVTTMEVTDEYPLVKTGYLTQSIFSITDFYQQQLGDPLKITGSENYRTLFYNYQNRKVRISLYHRNYVTEVSIMIEKAL